MSRFFLLFAFVASAFSAPPTAIAIHNARVVPVSGPGLSRGTVVIRNGLIEAVGAAITVPPDAWVLEGDGLTVYPGLIDALSTVGIPEPTPASPGPGAALQGGRQAAMLAAALSGTPPARGPEDRPSTTSWVKAADLIRANDPRIEQLRSAGFTSTVTFPTQGIFAGQGAVLDLAGEKPGQMVVADAAGQYLTMSSNGYGGGFPGSLMGTISYIRQIYSDAAYYQKARQFYAAHPRSMQRPDYDRALEGVLASPRILLPASRRVDADRMIRFAEELKQPFVLYNVTEGYRSADLLQKAKATVLVNLRWPEKAADSDPEQLDTLQTLQVRSLAPSTPAALARRGIRFALYSGGITRRSEFLKAVRRALDAGLTPDDALKALTLAPAEIYGVSDRLGSIERGKIANLVVTKGDLFQETGEVKYVFVDGRQYVPVPEAQPSPSPNRPAIQLSMPTPDLPVRTPTPTQGVPQ